MSLNKSGDSFSNSSSGCGKDMNWEQNMEKMYTYFYLVIFIPGLLLNTIALWVLCRHIRKKTKTVIFMINLAVADFAHVLSLPLRIYYYFTHMWPFGRGICLFCFYLKYLNMYAAIVFLVCISMQRYFFLLNPFSARQWRRRNDLFISVAVWLLVGLSCSPFILMRNSNSNADTIIQVVPNTSYSMDATFTQQPSGYTKVFLQPLTEKRLKPPTSSMTCFKDLPMRRLSLPLAITMMALSELFGFVIPLACISYCSIRIAWTLHHQRQGGQDSVEPVRCRLQSNSSSLQAKEHRGEKEHALRAVLSCSALFLLCFAPYHLNFLLYLLVSQEVVWNCAAALVVQRFHPVSLCLASMSCCLNPALYYFQTSEFRMHLRIRTNSFTSSIMSSPISSPTQHPLKRKLQSMESACSKTV
uniref:P2Y receptor family member 10 n=2 Tax=Gouania willdenowi TaxID=441366 RepID=A0A8C5I2S6_GOUWI